MSTNAHGTGWICEACHAAELEDRPAEGAYFYRCPACNAAFRLTGALLYRWTHEPGLPTAIALPRKKD